MGDTAHVGGEEELPLKTIETVFRGPQDKDSCNLGLSTELGGALHCSQAPKRKEAGRIWDRLDQGSWAGRLLLGNLCRSEQGRPDLPSHPSTWRAPTSAGPSLSSKSE